MATMKVNVVIDPTLMNDLNAKLVQAPALSPYIISKMAGYANIRVAVPGILSGKLSGFKPRTGRTRRKGLRAIWKNSKTGFSAALWTPLFNIFTSGTKRGIKPVPLIDTLAAQFEATSIASDVIQQALEDFDNNKLTDLASFTALGIKRRRRR